MKDASMSTDQNVLRWSFSTKRWVYHGQGCVNQLVLFSSAVVYIVYSDPNFSAGPWKHPLSTGNHYFKEQDQDILVQVNGHVLVC